MADEQEPEVIRQQMEVQRASLAEKLDTLENKIVETVQGAREAVAETVQTVKESVQSSVETVKDTVQSSVDTMRETFDITQQVQRHPWAMFGGSVALGFAAGWLVNRMSASHPPSNGAAWGYSPPSYTGGSNRFRDEPRAATSFTGAPTTASRPDSSHAAATAAASEKQGESWVDQVTHTFGPEIQKLKGVAIGTALGVVRDLVSRSIPDQLRPQVTEVINGITTKLGGEPVQNNILDQFMPQQDEHHNGRRCSVEGVQG